MVPVSELLNDLSYSESFIKDTIECLEKKEFISVDGYLLNMILLMT